MRVVWAAIAIGLVGCAVGEPSGLSDGFQTFDPAPTASATMGPDTNTSDPGMSSTVDPPGDTEMDSGPGPDDTTAGPDATSMPPPDTGCVPDTEVCNGVDDDCNDMIDESDPMLGQPCDTGMPGECSAGTQICDAGSLLCDPDGRSQPETCNGLDDDCDGTPDNGNPEGGGACSTGLPGICAAGTEMCNLGSLDCEQNQPAAGSDTCGNGLDDDCDGTVDDGCLTCFDFDLGNAVPQSVMGSNVGQGDSFPATCGAGGGADTLYRFEAPAAGSYTFDMIGSSFDTVLVAYSDCLGTQIACNDDFAGNPACGCCSCSEITVPMAAGQAIIIAVDGYNGATGSFTLNIN